MDKQAKPEAGRSLQQPGSDLPTGQGHDHGGELVGQMRVTDGNGRWVQCSFAFREDAEGLAAARRWLARIPRLLQTLP